MATRTIVVMVDDIDAAEIAEGKGETINFCLDGVSYAIDLNDGNAQKLRDALSTYIEHGRKTGQLAASPASAKRTDKAELTAAREWLRNNGENVSDRGRIAARLMDKFQNATKQ